MFYPRKCYLVNVFMGFVKIGYVSAIKATVESNASIQNSFVVRFERKKMRLPKSS